LEQKKEWQEAIEGASFGDQCKIVEVAPYIEASRREVAVAPPKRAVVAETGGKPDAKGADAKGASPADLRKSVMVKDNTRKSVVS